MSLDRTNEFKSFATSLPSGAPAANRVLLASQPSHDISSSSSTAPSVGRYGLLAPIDLNPSAELRDFHAMAGLISSDISVTSSQLAELTQLVRSRNLFLAEDDSSKINSLVGSIKSNIESLHYRLDEAQKVLNEKKRRFPKNSQAGQEATNVVDQLRHEFVQATQGFKKVLQQRSDGMKEVQDRKSAVLGQSDSSRNINNNNNASAVLGNRPPVYGSSNTFHSGLNNTGRSLSNAPAMPLLDLSSAYLPAETITPAGESTSSTSGLHLPRPHGISGMDRPTSLSFASPAASGLRSRHSASSSFSAYGAVPLTPVDIARMEEESSNQSQLQLIPDQTYLQDRANAMNQVESNIVELGTIFQKLAVMVSEHREMVQRIEDNVEEASSNVELSMAALTDTLSSLRTNRALFLKVFGIIVTFIILFITFFA